MKNVNFMLLSLSFVLLSCSGKMDENQFTNTFVEKIKELKSDISIINVKPLEVHYKTSTDKEPLRAYLDNAYKNYINGDDLNEVVTKFAEATIESTNSTGIFS